MLVVTAEEMRRLDRETIEELGVPGVVLMETAGRGVVDVIARLVEVPGARVVVYAGPGNNGGDGFVVARHLRNRGADARVILCAPRDKVKGDARVHFEAAVRAGVPVVDATDDDDLDAAADATSEADVVVDALLGTGLEREVTGLFARAIGHVNAHRGVCVAVDVPSGLDADRGVPLGACVRARHTVTFAFPKRGLVTAPGFTWAGTLHVVDIGIPERLALARGVRAELLDGQLLRDLATPDPLGHKGTHGHVLVVAGSRLKGGAALLAGGAALRAGAGLVTLGVPEDALPVVQGRVPELMLHPWAPEMVERKDALAIGPGMPTAPEVRPFLRALLQTPRPLVLDADGLNHLAAEPSLLDGRPAPTVLTPHPGEAARLLGRDTAAIQADRIASAVALSARFGAVVTLKGARTVVAAPDGRLGICPTGNPALGTAGTGDVLTGMIGALLARGLDAYEAACAAVYWHGAAGDLAAAELAPMGLMAGDVIEALPRALKALLPN